MRRPGHGSRHASPRGLEAVAGLLADRIRTLTREQLVATPLDQVFAFFSDAANLEALTPPWLGFKILNAAPLPIEVGTLIDYKLSLRGLPVRWRTRIDVWEPGHRFVDVQLKGPYRRWIHTHTFAEQDGGTLIGDRVEYQLPFGPLGAVAYKLVVARDLERIFAYRQQRAAELFGDPLADP